MGAAFDDGRGHAQVYATYRRQNPVLQSSRDYSFCALTAIPDSIRAPRGSRATVRALRAPAATSTVPVRRPRRTGTFFTSNNTFHVEGNQFLPASVPFNFNPYNYFQRPDERYTFGGFADYEISPGAKPYLEAMFMDDHTDAQIAPSGDFFNTNTINCDNPLLSAQQLAAVCTTAISSVSRTGQAA